MQGFVLIVRLAFGFLGYVHSEGTLLEVRACSAQALMHGFESFLYLCGGNQRDVRGSENAARSKCPFTDQSSMAPPCSFTQIDTRLLDPL
jgi:hypothetical protein